MNLHDTRAQLVDFAQSLSVASRGVERGYEVGVAGAIDVRTVETLMTLRIPGVTLRYNSAEPTDVSVDILHKGNTVTTTIMAIGGTSIICVSQTTPDGQTSFVEGSKAEKLASRTATTAYQKLGAAASSGVSQFLSDGLT